MIVSEHSIAAVDIAIIDIIMCSVSAVVETRKVVHLSACASAASGVHVPCTGSCAHCYFAGGDEVKLESFASIWGASLMQLLCACHVAQQKGQTINAPSHAIGVLWPLSKSGDAKRGPEGGTAA